MKNLRVLLVLSLWLMPALAWTTLAWTAQVLLLATPPVVQPLRSAVSRALVGQQFVSGLTAGFVQGQSRMRMYLGDASLSELRVCYGNWAGQSESPGSGNLVVEAALESDAPLGVARFLWSGANTITLTPGQTACSDPVFPSAFGLSVFPANASEWFRTGDTATTNGGHPSSVLVSGPGESMWAGPAFTSQVNATGPMTTPAGGGAASGALTPFAVLGRYTVPMPTLCDIGDSISAGVNDTQVTFTIDKGSMAGNGYVGRAAYNIYGTQIYPTFKLGIGGDGAGVSGAGYTGRATFFQYCTHGVTGWGVNDIEGSSAATVFNNFKFTWSLMHAAGIQYIFAATVTPKGTSTDNWLTEANQSYFDANFIPGGPKDQLNTLVKGSVGANFLTNYVDIGGAMGGVDIDKWSTSFSSPTVSYTPNVTVTSGTNSFSFSTGTFTSADVGKNINIAGAGAAGATLATTINAVGSTTTVTTANNAGSTLAAAAELTVYGTPATSDGLHPLGVAHAALAPLLTAALQSVGPQLPAQDNSWVPTGADWAMDLKNGRYYHTNPVATFYQPSTATGIAFTTRTSDGYGVTADTTAGTLIHFAPATPRITPGRGVLAEKAATNLFASPFAPATQTATVVNATQYTASIVGPGSLTLSGACSGTVTAGSPVTCTSSTTSLIATVTGSPLSMQVETGAVATSPISGSRSAEEVGFPVAGISGTTGTMVVTVEKTPPNVAPLMAAFGASYINVATSSTINTNNGATLTATCGAGANGHTVAGISWNGGGPNKGLDCNGGTIATDANTVGSPSQNYLGGRGSGGGDSSLNTYIQMITHYPGYLTGATSPTFQQATTP